MTILVVMKDTVVLMLTVFQKAEVSLMVRRHCSDENDHSIYGIALMVAALFMMTVVSVVTITLMRW